ncbi:MAG: Rieske 2Fe-2S domain-containing protein [Legionellaceae bacterium]
MQIATLGHAGFCVETDKSIIIMDPWLSPHGAFDAAWFQYPRNHHLAAKVQSLLTTKTKNKYIYISHEHQDHYDLSFLQSLRSRNFTLLLAKFKYSMIKDELNRLAYSCKNIVELNNEELYMTPDCSIVLFILDNQIACDSAILVKDKDHTFLNMNDCKINDRLATIKDQYGPIDVLSGQFSGASWYPTCYQMTKKSYEIQCESKVEQKFISIAKAIATIKPKLFLPSAGPPCFLDPLLFDIQLQEINTYPRAAELIQYLNQHHRKLKKITTWIETWPGDAIDINTLQIKHDEHQHVLDHDFKTYIKAYAKDYAEFFDTRQKENKAIHPELVFKALKEALRVKINALKGVCKSITPLLYWRISDYPEHMYCIDLAEKTISVRTSIEDPHHYYRITSPAWVMNKVLNQTLSWSDVALTFRVQLERVPDVYNDMIHAFLVLDEKKLRSYCKQRIEEKKKNERIIIENEGIKYSILRYCPHQGADLKEAWFKDGCLICPRHQWAFDLKHQGACKNNGTSIDALCIQDDSHKDEQQNR